MLCVARWQQQQQHRTGSMSVVVLSFRGDVLRQHAKLLVCCVLGNLLASWRGIDFPAAAVLVLVCYNGQTQMC